MDLAGSGVMGELGHRMFLRYILSQPDGDFFAGGDFVAVGGNDQETIGSCNGGDVAGTLPLESCDMRLSPLPSDMSRQEMRHSRLFV